MRVYPDLTDCWQKEANSATTALTILSPYITGDTTKNVAACSAGARIYTLFTSQVFASGASSLDVIADLVRRGRKVFRINNLHAKVVMDEDRWVTIGSQNLTDRGRKINREVSVYLATGRARQQVRDQIAPWLAEATPITLAMIEDMSKGLDALRKKYDALQVLIDKHQASFEEGATSWDMRERSARIAAAQQRLRRSLNPAKLSNERKRGKMKQPQSYSGPSLVTSAKLTNWPTATLDPRFRYLCILESGQFGWARLTENYLTFIARTIVVGTGIFRGLPGITVRLTVDPRAFAQVNEECNLVVELKIDSAKICRVPMTLTAAGLEMGRPIPARLKERGTRRVYVAGGHQAGAWVTANEKLFKRKILREIIEPFNFEDGEKLFGVRANTFFGPLGTSWELRLGRIRGQPYLAVGKLGTAVE